MVACDGRVTPTGGAHQEVTSWSSREERGRVGVVVRERKWPAVHVNFKFVENSRLTLS